MKRFEKNDLFKITGLMVLLTAILTWLIPYGYFNGGELVTEEITRIGIFDFFTYGLLGLYYFTVLVTFLLVLCGFYQVLSKIPAYQKITSSIAKKLKGKEILFATITSFIIAVITAFINEYFVVIAFLPFIITICSKLKMDKLSTLYPFLMCTLYQKTLPSSVGNTTLFLFHPLTFEKNQINFRLFGR